ncbi:hypothetical protein [Allosphingosinicella indica]|uniref:Uncharacterized protein n=1 Tax=Allosphingosinicella indica TaxID=941907 RepID=A0A1X7GJA6_9SPHN|nr:hypothetical protein [Allosphingosinicella indica]SMF70547.1 hypothetical protein SAMN06295910_1898 [Allosphingosinicella indica]
MTKVKAILLRPLDGNEIGSVMQFDRDDFERLKERGAVRAAPPAKPKADGKRAGGSKQAAKPSNKKAAAPANKGA